MPLGGPSGLTSFTGGLMCLPDSLEVFRCLLVLHPLARFESECDFGRDSDDLGFRADITNLAGFAGYSTLKMKVL